MALVACALSKVINREQVHQIAVVILAPIHWRNSHAEIPAPLNEVGNVEAVGGEPAQPGAVLVLVLGARPEAISDA